MHKIVHTSKRVSERTKFSQAQPGFTLMEMAVVLVIIGLLAAGILVGQSMLSAAAVRAQITQIDKYNAAVNAFNAKYQALPGDINATLATRFGFAARGSYPGEGDGNGVIEGVLSNAASQDDGQFEAQGETVMFWEDLSQAGLLDGSFTVAGSTSNSIIAGGGCITANSLISQLLPAARIGNGNFVYVWSGTSSTVNVAALAASDKGLNFFGVSPINQICSHGDAYSSPGMTVAQAYSIDTKIDDGLPQSGTVEAKFLQTGACYWAPTYSTTLFCHDPLTAYSMAASSTSCFDNGNGAAGTPTKYSMTQKGGSGQNCALSFQMQSAAR